MNSVVVNEKLLVETIMERVERFANRVGNILMRETVDVIDKQDVRATAQLRKSITYNVRVFGTFVVVKVFSPLNYAIYAHEGRRPGRFPPLEPIQRWVRMKRLSGRYTVASRRRIGGVARQWNEDRAAAFAIARAIAKRGTKGVKFFDMALRQALPKIEEMSV